MRDPNIEKGVEVRRDVLGEPFEAAINASITDYSKPFHDLALGYVWGSVWGRDGLERKTRCLLNVGFMMALNRQRELEVHMQSAIRNGATWEEVREVILQGAVYLGIPAGGDAMRTAQRLMAENTSAT